MRCEDYLYSTSPLPTLSPLTAECWKPPAAEEFDRVVSEDEGRGMSVVCVYCY